MKMMMMMMMMIYRNTGLASTLKKFNS